MAANSREMSSSPGLSTPPKSPESPSSGEAIVVQPKVVTYPDLSKSPTLQKSTTVKAGRGQTAVAGESAKQPRKRGPKAEKKKDDPNAPPKQRKPRAKKAKDAEDPKSSSAGMQRLSSAEHNPTMNKVQATKQPRINEVMFTAPPTSQPNQVAHQVSPAAHAYVPIGNKNEAIQKPIKPEPTTASYVHNEQQMRPSAPPPSSRGQNYDPIRSSTIEVPRPLHFSNPATPAQTSPIKTTSRASASPSIASLINPPTTQIYQSTSSTSRPSSSSASKLQISPQQNAFVQQPQKSAASVDSPRSVPPIPTPTVKPPTPEPGTTAPAAAMEIDSDAPTKPAKSANASRKPSVSTVNSSAVPSPKQTGAKSKNITSTPTLPPLPGTGLLSSSTLFGNGASNESNTRNQTIIIEVPLIGENNKYINFARLAEEKYGYNALYPKLAAQKDRLARVAAAGAALEHASKNGTSADEMSLDVSEGEGEQSNIDKKGSGEDGKPKKRKRTMKEDQYDKDDPFVDDSEMAWEEQAAASKDGFFVYSGPLIQPGQKPEIERADGSKPPTRGRGRGRGGGPGSRGGRGSRGGGAGRGKPVETDANGEPVVKRPRGGGATRKPRITKADRARMEQEKLERERAAQGLTGTNGVGVQSSTASMVVLPKSPAAPTGPAVTQAA